MHPPNQGVREGQHGGWPAKMSNDVDVIFGRRLPVRSGCDAAFTSAVASRNG